ncbi:MAG: type II toxin-antitoxin system HicB family antitoxin, partial [Dongiaceae bacterium]
LQLHLAGMTEESLDVPAPSELDDIGRDPEVAEMARIVVRGELPSRLERVNITMDEGLLKVIDAAAEARGMTRSGFLAEGARQLLVRQGRRQSAAGSKRRTARAEVRKAKRG